MGKFSNFLASRKYKKAMGVVYGIGASVGTYIAGRVVDKFCAWEGGHLLSRPEYANGWQTTWFIFAGYALVVALMFMILFRYKHDPNKQMNINH